MERTHVLLASLLLLAAAGIVAGLVGLALSSADFEEDFTPPMITDVSANSITHNAAVITWTTDEPATTIILYGRSVPDDTDGGTDSYASGFEVNPWGGKPPLSTSHSFPIASQWHDALEPDTTYTYRVKSVDAAGNRASSDEYTFTTLPSP